jgi:hypothetical protein
MVVIEGSLGIDVDYRFPEDPQGVYINDCNIKHELAPLEGKRVRITVQEIGPDTSGELAEDVAKRKTAENKLVADFLNMIRRFQETVK